MPFKSDKMRKYVMALLTGQRHTLIGYHASVDSVRTLSDEKLFHVGTRAAAMRRGRDKARGEVWSKPKSFFHLYEVSVPVRKERILLTGIKPRRIPRDYAGPVYPVADVEAPSRRSRVRHDAKKRFFDEGLGVDFHRLDPLLNLDGESGYSPAMIGSRMNRLIRRLRKRYDIIPYINRNEDPGSVSAAILNPKKARLKLVRRVPYDKHRRYL